ncbi:DUF2628 domain-containing protein [Mycobacteroides abscessus]|uniref:DUF2628 domain-containing protein n=1 Tax=Mycobacteroides abscessus TaxID=36809 RepID=UPI0009A6EC2F|nr:DUF2628 domain-containing protein [Mycobacteroides abscessus]SKP77638.1 Protein of uncharacterised function (DUF2628) [Mycobacteroides abscessus subsp. massiliense]
MTIPQDRSALAEIWQRRFAFYDHYAAAPTKEEANAIFRAGPFWTRLRLTSNFLAFFFGPIYFFVKGMWRKGLVLLGISLGIGVVLGVIGASDSVTRAVSIGFAAMFMGIANQAYYLHWVRKSESWNPFEGVR